MARAPTRESILGELAKRVRAARARVELTQEEASSRAGIDYKRWQRIEAGTANPSMVTLARIAAALETSVWKMLGK